MRTNAGLEACTIAHTCMNRQTETHKRTHTHTHTHTHTYAHTLTHTQTPCFLLYINRQSSLYTCEYDKRTHTSSYCYRFSEFQNILTPCNTQQEFWPHITTIIFNMTTRSQFHIHKIQPLLWSGKASVATFSFYESGSVVSPFPGTTNKPWFTG